MTAQKRLAKIKEFAKENWYKDEVLDDDIVIAEDDEFGVTNPWIDRSARFELDDAGAVSEWGLATVIDFCIKAWEVITNEG